ncbi:hypothetical protein [Orgyia pseudotsugata single capsid nuclopolyhedrovirus]|nr:hypothetical protein [Orgyia pseudotsugata single capsid nuclopolyhedrovirus]
MSLHSVPVEIYNKIASCLRYNEDVYNLMAATGRLAEKRLCEYVIRFGCNSKLGDNTIDQAYELVVSGTIKYKCNSGSLCEMCDAHNEDCTCYDSDDEDMHCYKCKGLGYCNCNEASRTCTSPEECHTKMPSHFTQYVRTVRINKYDAKKITFCVFDANLSVDIVLNEQIVSQIASFIAQRPCDMLNNNDKCFVNYMFCYKLVA